MTFDEITSGWVRFNFKSNSKARKGLWRKLSKLLRDGIPLIAGLQEIRNLRKPSDPMSIAIDDWIRGLNNGRKLSEVIHPWVSSEESMLILAGEQSGTLEDALQSVVKVSNAAASIKSALLGGLGYPSFLMLVAFGALYFFSFKIIPAFAKAARPEAWSGMAKTMMNSADFLQTWLIWLVFAFALLIIAFVVSLPRWNSPVRVILDRYAPYSIYRIMQGSSWLISIAALVGAGVRVETALQQLNTYSSAWAKVRLDAALKGLRSGHDLGQSLNRSGYEFPDREIISDIRLYATKSGFDEALRILGDEWIVNSVERIEDLMKIIFIIAMAFVGVVISFIASGFIAMQMQLTQILQQSTR
jgi:type II secretory pathway component PulF